MQHVTELTHSDGHSLDLVTTRANVNGMVSNCRVRHRISDHFAVHCNLHFAKPPLERKEISFRKTRSIDFTRFREELASSSLFTDPSCELVELVEQYNNTLLTLLDNHAPLKTRTVTFRPHSPW